MKKFAFANKKEIKKILDIVTDIQERKLQYVGIELLKDSKFQTRHDLQNDSLIELADSIKHNGLAQPPLVKFIDEHNYELIAGHRRVAACKLLGHTTIPVIIGTFSETEAQALNLIENIQREDLNPIEEAKGIKRLIENHGFTQEQAAISLGKTRSLIANNLRLLTGSDLLQSSLIQGHIQKGHAKPLLTLDENTQDRLVNLIIDKQLSVRETEQLAKKLYKTDNPKKMTPARFLHPSLEKLSTENRGLKIKAQASKGQGRVIIDLETEEDVNKLIMLLSKNE